MSTVTVAQDETGAVGVDLTIGGDCPFVAVVDVVEELQIDDIQAAYLAHPGKAVWWGVLKSVLADEVDSATAAADETEARLYEALRLEAVKQGVPATMRDKVVKARRAIHPDYIRVQATIRTAKANLRIVSEIVKAWDGRREMLISLGAHKRKMAERGEDLRIVDKMRDRFGTGSKSTKKE